MALKWLAIFFFTKGRQLLARYRNAKQGDNSPSPAILQNSDSRRILVSERCSLVETGYTYACPSSYTKKKKDKRWEWDCCYRRRQGLFLRHNRKCKLRKREKTEEGSQTGQWHSILRLAAVKAGVHCSEWWSLLDEHHVCRGLGEMFEALFAPPARPVSGCVQRQGAASPPFICTSDKNAAGMACVWGTKPGM